MEGIFELSLEGRAGVDQTEGSEVKGHCGQGRAQKYMHCLRRRRKYFGEVGVPGVRREVARAEPSIGSLGQGRMQCLRGNGVSLKDGEHDIRFLI